MSLQPPLLVKTSPAIANIEYNVSGFSLGPATLAYNSLSKITNSDRTPSLTNVHDPALAVLPLTNLCELLVPHSSSEAHI